VFAIGLPLLRRKVSSSCGIFAFSALAESRRTRFVEETNATFSGWQNTHHLTGGQRQAPLRAIGVTTALPACHRARLRSPPAQDHRGVDLVAHTLPFGRLWYGESDAIANAVGYAKFFSCSHHSVIRVFDDAGKVIETHEHTGGGQ
jgi:hypothetical protein